MADFSFVHVFGVSLVVQTLSATLFSPSTLMKSVAKQATGGIAQKANPM